MRAFFFILLISWSALHSPGQTFNNRYSFPNYQFGNGYSVEQIGDSLIVFSHLQDSLHKLGCHLLDLSGNMIDQKQIIYSDGYPYIGYSNTTDKNSLMIVNAGTVDWPDDRTRGYILKWDYYLDTLQSKIFKSFNPDSVLIFQQSKIVSDGILAVGSVNSQMGVEKILLLKTDFQLNEIWRKEYGSSTVPHAGYSVVQTVDGGYLIGGVRKIADTWDHCVIKTTPTGIQQHIGYYGNEFKCYYAMVANAIDGNYYFGGRLQVEEMYHDYSQVCKLDTQLDTIWCKVYGNVGADCRVNSLKLLPDGNLVACGSDRSTGVMFGYVMKIDPDGNLLWYRKYTQTEGNWCFFYDVIQTTDGGYFLTGSLSPDVGLSQDIWGIKLDDMGCLIPGCDTVQHVFSTDAGVGFSIFPNPTTQFINVYVSSPNPVDHIAFELSDLQGRIVKTFSPTLFDTTYMIDVQNLPAGMYVLKMLRDGVMMRSEKIVRE